MWKSRSDVTRLHLQQLQLQLDLSSICIDCAVSNTTSHIEVWVCVRRVARRLRNAKLCLCLQEEDGFATSACRSQAAWSIRLPFPRLISASFSFGWGRMGSLECRSISHVWQSAIKYYSLSLVSGVFIAAPLEHEEICAEPAAKLISSSSSSSRSLRRWRRRRRRWRYANWNVRPLTVRINAWVGRAWLGLAAFNVDCVMRRACGQQPLRATSSHWAGYIACLQLLQLQLRLSSSSQSSLLLLLLLLCVQRTTPECAAKHS